MTPNIPNFAALLAQMQNRNASQVDPRQLGAGAMSQGANQGGMGAAIDALMAKRPTLSGHLDEIALRDEDPTGQAQATGSDVASFLERMAQVTERPNPYAQALEQLLGSDPEEDTRRVFEEKYKIKGKGAKGIGRAIAESLRAIGQGANYRSREDRAKEEADSDRMERYKMLVGARQAEDAARNHEMLGLARSMNADVANKRANTAQFSAEQLSTYRNKKAEADKALAEKRISRWDHQNLVSKAQADLYSSRSQLVDTQVEQTQVDTENKRRTKGLSGAFGFGAAMASEKPETAEKMSSSLGTVMDQMKRSKFAPAANVMAAQGGRTMNKVDLNAEYWNPQTEQIENIPMGIAWKQGSNEHWGIGPVGRTKLDTRAKIALNMGKQAAGTAQSLVSTVADAYVSGAIDQFAGPFTGSGPARWLRERGFSNPFNPEESYANLLRPTGMLQHLSQIAGGVVSDMKMKHFIDAVGVEKATTKKALIYNAIVLRLATQHNNNLIGNVERADSLTPNKFAEIRTAIADYVKKVEQIAALNKTRRKIGQSVLTAPDPPNLNSFLFDRQPNDSGKIISRPLGTLDNRVQP